IARGLGAQDANIFDAHLLILEDPALIEEVSRMIEQDEVSADYAFHLIAEKYIQTLSAISDDYLRERVTDMRDVTSRVVDNLLGRSTHFDLRQIKEPCIVVSYDLTPTQTAQINREMVRG